MLHFQQHTSPCYVTSRAGIMTFNLRHHEHVEVQPSSVISGETWDCSMSISLHPELGGVNCPQVVPPLPLMPRPPAGGWQTSRWILTEMKLIVHIIQYFCLYIQNKRKFRLEILIFFFCLPFCVSIYQLHGTLQSPFYTWPTFPNRTLTKPSLKVKQNFTCYSRKGLTGEFFCIKLQQRGAYLSHQGISGL